MNTTPTIHKMEIGINNLASIKSTIWQFIATAGNGYKAALPYSKEPMSGAEAKKLAEKYLINMFINNKSHNFDVSIVAYARAGVGIYRPQFVMSSEGIGNPEDVNIIADFDFRGGQYSEKFRNIQAMLQLFN